MANRAPSPSSGVRAPSPSSGQNRLVPTHRAPSPGSGAARAPPPQQHVQRPAWNNDFADQQPSPMQQQQQARQAPPPPQQQQPPRPPMMGAPVPTNLAAAAAAANPNPTQNRAAALAALAARNKQPQQAPPQQQQQQQQYQQQQQQQQQRQMQPPPPKPGFPPQRPPPQQGPPPRFPPGGPPRGGGGSSWEDMPVHAAAAPPLPEDPAALGPLVQCECCGRSFNQQAYSKHAKVCAKVFATKRKVFNAAEARVQGTEAAKFFDAKRGAAKGGAAPSRAGPSAAAAAAAAAKKPGGMAKWKAQSEQLRAAMRNNRMLKEAQERGEDISKLQFEPTPEELDDRCAWETGSLPGWQEREGAGLEGVRERRRDRARWLAAVGTCDAGCRARTAAASLRRSRPTGTSPSARTRRPSPTS